MAGTAERNMRRDDMMGRDGKMMNTTKVKFSLRGCAPKRPLPRSSPSSNSVRHRGRSNRFIGYVRPVRVVNVMAPSDASQIQRIKIKPLVVIVPGAWHTAAHFGSLIHILQARGFEIIFVSLPSIGGRVESDLQSDADAVSSEVKRILGEATTLDNDSNGEWHMCECSCRTKAKTTKARGPRDILVVSHSRGGAPTTLAISASQSRYNRALRGLEGGVVHLLYICAFAPFPGESVVTCFAGVRAPVKVHPVSWRYYSPPFVTLVRKVLISRCV